MEFEERVNEFENRSIGSIQYKKKKKGEFPGGPVVRTWRFHCRGPGSIPGQGTKIQQATQHGQKKEREREREKD